MGVARKLFENTKMLLLESPDMTDSEQLEVERILKEYEVPYEVKEITEEIDHVSFLEKDFTHIISNSIMFTFYEFTQDKLIPVVNSAFIFTAVELGRQPAIRPYSPDPRNVLKDVHVCVGGLPESDKEAIFGGVRALGGTYSETLSKFVTHLISMDPLEDCCICVQSLKDINIQTVLPEWIDDCLKFRKRIDETPYLLKPDIPVQTQIESLKTLDVQIRYNPDYEAEYTFLGGKKFYFGTDLGLTERAKRSFITLIEKSGGQIVSELHKANCYVGKYRDGEEYIEASRNGIYVGNTNWIYFMFEHQKLISPFRKLLHHPFVRGGLKGMEECVISSTNYSGDARFYVMKLAEALGAKFTASLSQKNTHLITAMPSGKKFQYALKWNLTVVNHLWLEETYAKWKLQPANHPRYSHLPRSVKLQDIIGETPLDLDVLRSFYDPSYTEVTTNIVEDSEDEASHITLISKESFTSEEQSHGGNEKLPSLTNSTPRETPGTETETIPPAQHIQGYSIPQPVDRSTAYPSMEEVELRHEPEQEATEQIPPTKPSPAPSVKAIPATPKSRALYDVSNSALRTSSGRKAKSIAAAKLHEDMEDLNNFQKSHRLRDVPLLPEEIEARKRQREEMHSSKETRESPNAQTPKKKAKKGLPSSRYDIIAIATGWEVEFSRADMQILHNLGIKIHKELKNDINVIISPKVMRTEKFLTGLSYRLDYIISPLFLTDVLNTFKKNPEDLTTLPEAKSYSLDKKNKASVRALTDIPLETLLNKSRDIIDSGYGIFHGLTFNITAKVPGGAPTITKILKAHGADNVHVLKTLKDLKDLKSLKPCENKEVGHILISTERGFTEKAKSLLTAKATGKIVEWDWVVASIFNMDINHGKNVLFENHIK